MFHETNFLFRNKKFVSWSMYFLFRNKNIFHEININFRNKIEIWKSSEIFFFTFKRKEISFGRKKWIFPKINLPIVNPTFRYWILSWFTDIWWTQVETIKNFIGPIFDRHFLAVVKPKSRYLTRDMPHSLDNTRSTILLSDI